MTDGLVFLALCGSLRRHSFNRLALRAAQALAPSDVAIEFFDLAPLPPYNADDHEVAFPPLVQALRQRVDAADAILFVTPEYNYSVPSALKNAIDWASRPPSQPFDDKPIGMISASQGLSGGGRAQHHLRQIMIYLNGHFLNKPEVMITEAQTRFDVDGNLIDDATKRLITELLRNLALWTRRLGVHRGHETANHSMDGTSASGHRDVFVERLRGDDLGELLTLQRAAFVSDAQRYGTPFLPSLTQTLEQLRKDVSDSNRWFLAAKHGARLVGAVRAARAGRIIHISRLMTAPDLEGRGIASLLLDAIEAASAENADEFELTTGAKSTVNIGMYRRRGYRVTGESIDNGGIGVVHMRKAVSPANGASRGGHPLTSL